MKFLKLILILFLVSTLEFCAPSFQDKEVALELFTQIKGGGDFSFVKETLEKGKPISKKFIELEIDSSSVLGKNGLTKSLLASYCASYLFDNLEKSSLLDQKGINIHYSSDGFTTLDKPYYFKMTQLQRINSINGVLYDFTQSFSYGNLTSVYFSKNNDSLENIAINQNIQKLNSINLKDLIPTFSFHSTFPLGHKYHDKFLIIWIYSLPTNQTLAIDFVTEKEIEDGIIYNLEVSL
jgi:hypothetical protein